ncbi:MAG: hypothetical protein QXW70_01210 [Candidatus Anstonellales archaeon]
MDHSNRDINTQIDILVEFLKSKKVVEVSEAASVCGLGIKDTERWLRVLEERGLIELEYLLTKTYVRWKGKKAHVDHKENLVSQPHEKELEKEDTLSSPSLPQAFSQTESASPPLRKPKSRKKKKPLSLNLSANRLKEYIAEIEKEKKVLAKLHSEKEKIYEEVYLPIEKRMDTQLQTIAERLLEKEKTILFLQQRTMEIPETAQQMESYLEKIASIDIEARKVFQSLKTQIEKLLIEINQARYDTTKKVEENERDLFGAESKLIDLVQLLEKSKEEQQKLRLTIQEATAQIRQNMEHLEAAQKTYDSIETITKNLSLRLLPMRSSLETQKQKIKELSEQINRLSHIDRTVVEYINEYSRRLDEFERFAQESQKAYESLRESVETNFVRRYIDELKEVSEKNLFEAISAQRTEEEINRQIEASKKRIADLIIEAKSIVKSIEASVSTDEEPPGVGVDTLRLRARSAYENFSQAITSRDTLLEHLGNLEHNVVPNKKEKKEKKKDLSKKK